MPSALFVCVANSFRSQMAEAIARSLSGGAWEVESAGSHPSGRVHPLATALMQELGLDLSTHRSKGLDAVAGRRWDYVGTMGCGDACPMAPAQHRIDWALPDPAAGTLDDARRIRDDIAARVRELISRHPA
jgi:protein-tyrosine-phosphatase